MEQQAYILSPPEMWAPVRALRARGHRGRNRKSGRPCLGGRFVLVAEVGPSPFWLGVGGPLFTVVQGRVL